MRKFFLLVVSLGLIFAGCAKKESVKSEEPQQMTQKASAPEMKPEVKKEEPKMETPSMTQEGEKKVETVPVTEMKPATFMFGHILFDFDKYDVREDAKPELKKVSDWLIANKDERMLLEGHCDDRGTNEYNLALGERRAKSARDYVVSLGVKKGRLDIISLGEEKPLCKEQTEECWQTNRRVQFVNLKAEGKKK